VRRAVRHPNGDPFALDNRFRGGDTVQNTVGVLGFDFSLYRIQPVGPADYTSVNPRPAAPEEVGGRLTVAAGDLAFSFVGTSNATLVPSGKVTLGGSGVNRTITIAATPKTSGTAVLTFSLSDGIYSTTFIVTVQVGTDANETIGGTSGADLLVGLGGTT
jgi:hypothetical protein